MSDPSRIALVVGGSRGIGRAIALRLAQSGCDLWLTYRSNDQAAAETQSQITALGRKCELFRFDVADREAVLQALRSRCESSVPAIVVYNAGITRDGLLAMMSAEDWSSVIRTDLDGFFNVMSSVLVPMIGARRGRIVAISSVSGQVGQAGQVNYSAAKAGLIGACKALAREVAKRNILVNVVAPGLIETDMTASLPMDKILPLIPMGRVGKADEVASLVQYLCCESAMYMTGQVLGVNGGLAT